MPSPHRPRARADDAREALRRLAHATRSLEDPSDVYPILGDLSSGLASLAQSLHQIGDFHDGPLRTHASVAGDARTGRAACYQVAWEIHRAAEMLHQVAVRIDRAHEVEATIAYDDGAPLTTEPRPAPAVGPTRAVGMSL